jgi:superfamily I DNA and/or RNA helicase
MEMTERFRFSRVLIDEATMSTEGSSLIPITRGAQQLVLIGDQCQLPPVVKTRQHPAPAAARPLFNRLLQDGLPAALLSVQYRMHPAISQLPSDLFYAGAVSDGISASDRPPLAGFKWPRPEWPVAFVHVEAYEQGDDTSKLNRPEAVVVAQLVSELLAAGNAKSTIGVITPYASQVRLLKSFTRGAGGAPAPGDTSEVEVSSVDGFQGREKEIIIFSCVRANQNHSLGFLADPRRINVSITRAKSALIVCGHAPTLSSGTGPWAWWMRWARAHGVVVGETASGTYDSQGARVTSSEQWWL